MKESDFMLANNGFSTRDLKKKNENKHIINVIFQNSSTFFFFLHFPHSIENAQNHLR